MEIIQKIKAQSITVSLYTISKALFAIYVVYTQALSYTSFYIPRVSFVLLALTLLCNIIGTRTIYKGKYIIWYLAFIFYALVTGVILVVGRDPFIMSIRNLIEYFFSFYLIICFSRKDKSIDYSIMVFIALAFVMSILNLTMGQGINRITFSEDMNVNTIATVMMYAVGFVLYFFIKNEVGLSKWVLGFSVIALFIYMILITVSKKAILGTSFLLLFWALWCSGKNTTRGNARKIAILCFIMIGLYYGYEMFVKYMPTQYEYLLLRMSQLSEGSSTNKRRDLIKQGFEVFFRNPVFGVGLNNFRYYTFYNTYSHCFYSELFSCLGFFGALLFFVPFSSGIASMLRRIHNANDTIHRNRMKFLLAILGCLMGTSIAQIIFYEYELIYILGVICASREIEGYIN